MKTISFFLSISMICLFTNCTPFDLTIKPREECPPPKTDLPAATMSGSDRFGCVINDTLNWVAQVPFEWTISGESAVDLDWDNANKYLRVQSSRKHETSCEDIEQYFNIQFHDLSIGSTPIFRRTSVSYRNRRPDEVIVYFLDTTYQNVFELTHLDTENTTASGRFEFRLVNTQDSTDMLHVTDGRFDGNYAF